MKEFSYQEDPDRAGNKTNKLQRGQYEIKMLIYSIIPVKKVSYKMESVFNYMPEECYYLYYIKN